MFSHSLPTPVSSAIFSDEYSSPKASNCLTDLNTLYIGMGYLSNRQLITLYIVKQCIRSYCHHFSYNQVSQIRISDKLGLQWNIDSSYLPQVPRPSSELFWWQSFRVPVYQPPCHMYRLHLIKFKKIYIYIYINPLDSVKIKSIACWYSQAQATSLPLESISTVWHTLAVAYIICLW